VTLASGDEYTAYLRKIYHCDETGLEIEETSTIPKRKNRPLQKANKCEFTDTQFLREQQTAIRTVGSSTKNATMRKYSPAIKFQPHSSLALEPIPYDDTTHAADSQTSKVR
jgi:hypothetical protein